MLKKHHRDTGQRSLPVFIVKIKGCRVALWREEKPSAPEEAEEEWESARCGSV